MSVQEVLRLAKQQGVLFYLKDNKLTYQVKKNTLSPEIKKKIKDYRVEITKHLEKTNSRKNKFMVPPVLPADREQALPLSYAQQRLWFIDQLGEGSVQYNVPGRFLLQGEFKLTAFRKALKILLDRHEVLRTHFETIAGEPQQVVTKEYELPFTSQDLSMLSEKDKMNQVQQLIETEVSTPFNLGADLMLRLCVLNLSDNRHLVLYTMHHIACDGWSKGILQRELSVLYAAYSNGQSNPLSSLRIQYADYALWQRNWLQGEVLKKQLGYWQKQLADLPVVHSLPLDKQRPMRQSFEGKRIVQFIDDTTTEKLKGLCETQEVTLFMFLQTAFAALLGRYSNETDIVMGTPIAGRTHTDIETMIGFFVNTLVLRTDLSYNPIFSELLAANKDVILDAYAHQHIPFEMLVDEIRPERNLSHNPVTQISFMLQKNERGSIARQTRKPEHEGEKQTQHSINNRSIKFDLELDVTDRGDGLSVGWMYNESLFEEESVFRMMNNYGVLLNSIIKNLSNGEKEESNIECLELLSKREKQRLLTEWNDTRADYPQDKGLHEKFELQVKLSSETIALVHEKEQLTYGELNRRSNQLAHYLIAQGVSSQMRVGICIERSIEMLVGILAILKTGGSYVPLDPNFPKKRLSFLIENSGIEKIVTQSAVRSSLDLSEMLNQYGTQERAKRILDCVLIESHVGGNCKLDYVLDNPSVPTFSSDLAYVIYTSGSTGKPKGVRVTHKNASNFLASMQRQPGINSQDKLLAVTTLSFDIALLELFLPLTVGASVEIASQDNLVSGEQIAARLDNNQITLLQATPVTWKILLDSGWQGKANLKALVGGEAFAKELAILLIPKVKAVWNMYGPTETTVWSTLYSLPAKNNANSSGTVPIGTPIGNTQAYILDGQQQLSPIGVPGELYLGGAGVSQGYLDKADLTAQRFVPHPFSEPPGERLYRTGDLVRYLPNANIEFLGRIDQQVKVRGFRIELGEIESVLQQHKQVKDVVVVVREDDPGNSRLFAYVVGKEINKGDCVDQQSNQPEILVNALRTVAQSQLPAYMVPSAIVVLETMPLTANGKVDRNAISSLDQVNVRAQDYVAPTTETEILLADIWSGILCVPVNTISIYDSFFNIGGHSLLAIKLVAEINDALKTSILLSNIFLMHDIAGLASHIDEINSGKRDEQLNIKRLGLSEDIIDDENKEEFDL